MVTHHENLREISRSQKNSTPLRVLVADDEPLIRWSVSETLHDAGHEVVETGDARGARSAVRDASEPFDVIVLDLRLPDSNDLSLLASMRKLSPATPVILMTAYGSADFASAALDLGAFRVLNKPFELQDLASLVKEAARH
jgi:DNA-binding NtrC family response regulator